MFLRLLHLERLLRHPRLPLERRRHRPRHSAVHPHRPRHLPLQRRFRPHQHLELVQLPFLHLANLLNPHQRSELPRLRPQVQASVNRRLGNRPHQSLQPRPLVKHLRLPVPAALARLVPLSPPPIRPLGPVHFHRLQRRPHHHLLRQIRTMRQQQQAHFQALDKIPLQHLQIPLPNPPLHPGTARSPRPRSRNLQHSPHRPVILLPNPLLQATRRSDPMSKSHLVGHMMIHGLTFFPLPKAMDP